MLLLPRHGEETANSKSNSCMLPASPQKNNKWEEEVEISFLTRRQHLGGNEQLGLPSSWEFPRRVADAA